MPLYITRISMRAVRYLVQDLSLDPAERRLLSPAAPTDCAVLFSIDAFYDAVRSCPALAAGSCVCADRKTSRGTICVPNKPLKPIGLLTTEECDLYSLLMAPKEGNYGAIASSLEECSCGCGVPKHRNHRDSSPSDGSLLVPSYWQFERLQTSFRVGCNLKRLLILYSIDY